MVCKMATILSGVIVFIKLHSRSSALEVQQKFPNTDYFFY